MTRVAKGAKIVVFPELCLTGYTCGDLFLQETLLRKAKEGLKKVAAHTAGTDTLVFAGVPLVRDGKLYNTAAVLQNGSILAFVPKRFIPNYSEFYEMRHYTPGGRENTEILFEGQTVPFGSRILFDIDAVEGLSVAAELCEDVWVADAPDIEHALAGATLIVNLSASDEVVAKGQYRRVLLSGVSARTACAYIYADAGEGESSTDLVFAGQSMILENGAILAEAPLFEPAVTCADIDIHRLVLERRRMNSFGSVSGRTCFDSGTAPYLRIPLHMEKVKTDISDRCFDPHPFVPSDPVLRRERCEEIFAIQSRGLAKRLEHVGASSAVIGVSGGLDSTLALMVTARAFDLLGIPRKNILAVTMPCYGTTERTHGNARIMADALGTTLREIDIAEAVSLHFRDIGHDPENHDVTYENCQARERTQILMDLANQTNGLVIGTGDMSEIALGWATYNGDHMSMYAVNIGVPKTLVRHLVQYCADTAAKAEVRGVLLDVLDTPVSPELLPPTADGMISQKTEDLVGPYELHDFFLYYVLRWGFAPRKILRIAKQAFAGSYDDAVILKWLKKFYWRFFTQQFKRSCIPDGPKVGSVALSPRGDWRMPSDASVQAWISELDNL
jgi:NAD+ synthase (glutamine-hydrolysing)